MGVKISSAAFQTGHVGGSFVGGMVNGYQAARGHQGLAAALLPRQGTVVGGRRATDPQAVGGRRASDQIPGQRQPGIGGETPPAVGAGAPGPAGGPAAPAASRTAQATSGAADYSHLFWRPAAGVGVPNRAFDSKRSATVNGAGVEGEVINRPGPSAEGAAPAFPMGQPSYKPDLSPKVTPGFVQYPPQVPPTMGQPAGVPKPF